MRLTRELALYALQTSAMALVMATMALVATFAVVICCALELAVWVFLLPGRALTLLGLPRGKQ